MKSVIVSEVTGKEERILRGELVQLDRSMHQGSSQYVVFVTDSERTDTGKFRGTIVYSAYPNDHALSVGCHSDFIAASFIPFSGVIQLES